MLPLDICRAMLAAVLRGSRGGGLLSAPIRWFGRHSCVPRRLYDDPSSEAVALTDHLRKIPRKIHSALRIPGDILRLFGNIAYPHLSAAFLRLGRRG